MAIAIAFIPLIITILGIGVIGASVYKMPWLISFEIGTFLNGLSPSVAVPLMISLIERGIGTKKSIP